MGLFDFIGAALDAVTGGVSSVVATVLDVAGAASDASGSSTGTSIGSIIGSINDIVSNVRETLAPIIATVADTVKQVSDTIRNINDTLIQPIVKPIQDAYTIITSVIQVMHRDLSDGLKGILRIPGDIANAFASLDATMQRSMAMLNAGQADNLKLILTPALAYIADATIGANNKTLYEPVVALGEKWTPPPQFVLGEALNLQSFKEYAANSQRQLDENASLPAMFFKLVFKAVGILEGLTAQREPYIELWREEIRKHFPTLKLATGSVLEARTRGEITDAQAVDELTTQGYDETRARVLIATSRTLLGAGIIGEAYRRGQYTREQAADIFKDLGYDTNDAATALDQTETLISGSDLFTAYSRQELSLDGYLAGLKRLGYSDASAALIYKSAFSPPAIADEIMAVDRMPLILSAALISADKLQVPDTVLIAAQASGISAQAAARAWENHFRLYSPQEAVNAFYRGYVTRTQLTALLLSAAIPEALHDNIIDLNRPLIPARNITTLIVQGIIDEIDGMNILQARGYSLADANRLVQIERAAAKPSQSAVSADLHGLTQSTVFQLYDAGTLNADQVTTLLLELGLGADAITAMLALHDVKAAADFRASQVDLIVAQAKAGELTYTDALGALGGLGLTDAEVNKALAKLQTKQADNVKMPTESQLSSMYHYGILSRTALADALALLGFSTGWAELLIQLGEKHGVTGQQPASIG